MRQPLFTYADCLSAPDGSKAQGEGAGGAFKAQAAAYRLEEIFPEVHCDPHVLNIPMPGRCSAHTDSEIVATAAKIDDLVCKSDAVMLLTDSKESRWLPTAICKARNVLAITVALGFDSYLVMRHGTGTGAAANNSPSSETVCDTRELGCYFCNDVVAPGDSSVSTTLDQQCTVTRPGIAPIAAALGVEMLVGMLHCGAAFSVGSDLPEDDLRMSREEEQESRIRFHHVPGDVALALSVCVSPFFIDSFFKKRSMYKIISFSPPQNPDWMSKQDGLPRPLGILQHQIRGFLAHGTSLQVCIP